MKNNTKLEEISIRLYNQMIKRKSISWLKNTSFTLKMPLNHTQPCTIADSTPTFGVKCWSIPMKLSKLITLVTTSQCSQLESHPQFISMNNTHTWLLHGFMMRNTWMKILTMRILKSNISIMPLAVINKLVMLKNNLIKLIDYDLKENQVKHWQSW